MSTSAALPAPRQARPRRSLDAVLLVVLALLAAPLLWLILAAFDANASVQLKLPALTLANFARALEPGPLRGLLNSLLLATIATALATLVSFPAAYVLARRAVPLKQLLLVLVLFLSGVPITVLILPIFDVFSKLQLLSLVPAAVVLAVLNVPFELYIMKTAIEAIPLDLEDAARVERASTATILARIVLPLSLPSVLAAAIYGFINAWGNFLVPLILITEQASQPGPIVIYGFMGSVQVDFGAIAAYSIVYSLPIVLFYLSCSSLFRSGYILGGGLRG